MFGEPVPDNWEDTYEEMVESMMDDTECDKDVAEEAVLDAFWWNYEEDDDYINHRYFGDDCKKLCYKYQYRKDLLATFKERGFDESAVVDTVYDVIDKHYSDNDYDELLHIVEEELQKTK